MKYPVVSLFSLGFILSTQVCPSFGQTCSATQSLSASKTTENELKSPGYPFGYSANLDQCFRITSPSSSYHIKIQVTVTDLPDSGCAFDYLLAYDSSGVDSFKLMKKWCGNETFTSLQSTGRYLTVLFHTDGLSDASYAGFIIKYIAVPSDPSIRDCETTNSLTARSSHEYIESPNYPANYPANVSVCWTIEAASVFDIVKMEVISMDIESNSDCKDGDFIEVRDGQYATSTLMSRWCGSQTKSLTSSDEDMFIKFQSNEVKEGKGFKIKYYSVDPKDINGTNKLIGGVVGGAFGAFILLVIIGAVFGNHHRHRRRLTGVNVVNVNNVTSPVQAGYPQTRLVRIPPGQPPGYGAPPPGYPPGGFAGGQPPGRYPQPQGPPPTYNQSTQGYPASNPAPTASQNVQSYPPISNQAYQPPATQVPSPYVTAAASYTPPDTSQARGPTPVENPH